MKKHRTTLRKWIRNLRYLVHMVFISAMLSINTLFVAADNPITESKIGQGLEKLVKDITSFLMIVAPLAMVALIIYFFIRRGMADEMDRKQWNSRIVAAAVSGVGALLASVILNLILGYFV